MPTNYRRILSAFYGSPWAILPEKLFAIRDFLHLKAAGGDVPAEEIAALKARRGDSAAGVQMAGRVAVLPVYGTIAQRMGMVEEASGGTSTELVGTAFDQLQQDKAVKSIVLDIDSPGGSVFGVQELFSKIYSARGNKKVVALADSMAASAAYWIAAAADEIVVTPSGQVGSIGVFSAHEDLSQALAEEGVKVTLVSAGKYKTEGNPYSPLDEDGRNALQAEVDAYYALFVAAVAKGRGVSEAAVRNGFGQGRMATAKDAVSQGMADRIGTLEQVLSRLGAGNTPAGGRAEGEAPTPRAGELERLKRRLQLES
jgi:signal peptide peptidase SppA